VSVQGTSQISNSNIVILSATGNRITQAHL
jgi:hypothetical protein